METMQAALFREHGDPSVLKIEEVPRPQAGPGEVLVRILAASVNHLDLWVRRGMPGVKIPLPHIPGSDGVGEVVALGPGASGLKVGQKVVVLPGISSGNSEFDLAGDDHLSADYGIRGEHCSGINCEYVALEERYLLPLPRGIDPIEAAAIPLVFLTAWNMLILRAELQAAERVLVIAGASGVGSAAIQIARDRGAHVVATAGSVAGRKLCLELGADLALDHHDPEWSREVKAWSEGEGVDVVFEHVGPATWAHSLRALGRCGRLVTCGGTTGPKVELLLPHLFMKNLSVLGCTMGPSSSFPSIFERVANGAFRPIIDSVRPLAEIAEVHAKLEAGGVIGKILLCP